MPRLTEAGKTTCPCCMHPLTVEIDQTPPNITVTLHSKRVCDGKATYLHTKLAELDARLNAAMDATQDEHHNWGSERDEAKYDAWDEVARWLRAFNLVDGSTPNPKGTNAPS